LRDAVPVEFYEGGDEKARYKNIDIPDSLKELETTDFRFVTPESGKISFRLFFAPGILPAEFPPAREKMTRAEKAAAKAVRIETVAVAAIEAETSSEATVEPAEDAAPTIPEYRFNVTGERRKELAAALGSIIGWAPVYKGAPSFAYAVGNYIIDKSGTITGELSEETLAALAEQGFIPGKSEAA